MPYQLTISDDESGVHEFRHVKLDLMWHEFDLLYRALGELTNSGGLPLRDAAALHTELRVFSREVHRPKSGA